MAEDLNKKIEADVTPSKKPPLELILDEFENQYRQDVTSNEGVYGSTKGHFISTLGGMLIHAEIPTTELPNIITRLQNTLEKESHYNSSVTDYIQALIDNLTPPTEKP